MDERTADTRKFILSFSIKEAHKALDRAKSLLQLAEAAKDKGDKQEAQTLAGAAIVFAIAHLAQTVEFDLIGVKGAEEVKDRGRADARDISSQLPSSLLGKLRLLPTTCGGQRLRLDETKNPTKRLVRMIQLRNKLVHEEGQHGFGPLEDFDATIEGEEITIHIPVLRDPWDQVQLDDARFTVKAAEGYFVELDRMIEDASLPHSAFFRRFPSKTKSRPASYHG